MILLKSKLLIDQRVSSSQNISHISQSRIHNANQISDVESSKYRIESLGAQIQLRTTKYEKMGKQSSCTLHILYIKTLKYAQRSKSHFPQCQKTFDYLSTCSSHLSQNSE